MCVVEKGTHLQVLGFRNYERVMELTTGCISLTLNNRNEVSYSEGKNHNLLEITEIQTEEFRLQVICMEMILNMGKHLSMILN